VDDLSFQEGSAVEIFDDLEFGMVACGMTRVGAGPIVVILVREAGISGQAMLDLAGVDAREPAAIVELTEPAFQCHPEFAGRIVGAKVDEAAKREAGGRANVSGALGDQDRADIAWFDEALRWRTPVEACVSGRNPIDGEADLLLVQPAQEDLEREGSAARVAG